WHARRHALVHHPGGAEHPRHHPVRPGRQGRALGAALARLAALHPRGRPMTAALSFSNVGKTYVAKSGPIEALGRIDFDIGEGEFLSILGPSGCGKSTLLALASGLELP